MEHNCIAYYRLPYADCYYRVTSESKPLMLRSLEDIGSRPGFVIAPFSTASATDSGQQEHKPIVLITPDEISRHALLPKQRETSASPTACSEVATASEEYTEVFRNYHEAIVDGRFRKLVLARKKTIALAHHASCEDLFLRACSDYPRMMIMLFSTPQTGTWLISSPEILVESVGGTLHTIALAGTMPYEEGYAEWSEKNKAEQNIVERYIEATVVALGSEVVKDGPYTMRAGNLQHLRTDFRFQMSQTIGTLLAKLHPTPAVCGLPKAEAQRFIEQNEHMERSYYSGFAGPVGIDGDTHLYVSLRCAQLFDDHAELYAGGGIMPDSQCEQEWQETESKMETIKNVLE